MGQEIAVPDWAKQAPSTAFAQLNAQEDSLSEGIGQSYPVIGYKGKVWSLRHRGERHNFVRPDDGTPASYLDVIILGQAKQKSKSFYKKFDQNTSDGDRPICSSIDGVTPDADVQDRQCESCALCPRNIWKTDAQTGKKGRECTDYKRLAVLVLPSQSKAILGQPLMEPAFLRVPPASLNSLAIMGDTMAGQGFHYSSYITRITFDPNKPHPEMQFRPLQGLTEKEAPVILQMREDANVGRIISGGFVDTPKLVAPNKVEVLPPGTVASGLAEASPSTVAPSPAQGQSVRQGNPGSIQANGSEVSAAVPPVTPPPSTTPSSTPSSETGIVDTGFGGAGLAPTQQASPPTQPKTDDTGAPEATDADLDARIASLIKK